MDTKVDYMGTLVIMVVYGFDNDPAVSCGGVALVAFPL